MLERGFVNVDAPGLGARCSFYATLIALHPVDWSQSNLKPGKLGEPTPTPELERLQQETESKVIDLQTRAMNLFNATPCCSDYANAVERNIATGVYNDATRVYAAKNLLCPVAVYNPEVDPYAGAEVIASLSLLFRVQIEVLSNQAAKRTRNDFSYTLPGSGLLFGGEETRLAFGNAVFTDKIYLLNTNNPGVSAHYEAFVQREMPLHMQRLVYTALKDDDVIMFDTDEEEDGEDTAPTLPPLPEPGSRVCWHCGDTQSSQWRKGHDLRIPGPFGAAGPFVVGVLCNQCVHGRKSGGTDAEKRWLKREYRNEIRARWAFSWPDAL